jgi:hypothetical protein
MEERQNNDGRNNAEAPIELSAEEARGAEIILRSRARRIVFIAGLAGFVLFVLVFLYAR